jgi:DNA (cytosine-5)-methyltransferase 1
LKYLSVCSGIEAATVAWHPLGWQAVGFSEIEKFPSQVLAHHYPNVPNLGDMTKFKEWNLESNIDVFVGGTPCQSFSVAGLRKGLDDPRGNLMLTYLAIADKLRPRWLVWENVPGVLSSNGGKDFGTFLGGLGELGYGFAYRVLDAQYFGVAQRRRRVFVVGYLGDWRRAAAVLFERYSLSGNPAPRRQKREDPAKCLTSGAGQRYDFETEDLITQPIALAENTIGRQPENGGNGDGFTDGGPMYTLNATGVHGVAQPLPFGVSEKPDVSHCLRSGASKADKHESTTYIAQPVFFEPRSPDGVPRIYPMEGAAPTLNTMGGGQREPCVTHPSICLMDQGGSVMNVEHDMTGTLRRETHGHEPVVMQQMAVRRLTPKECERLQGFPDNYSDITPKGKPTPDGPRYKALGNSMAVPVMAWIGKRIQEVDNL